MPLVTYSDILRAARAGGYAVGYFESWDSYSLEAVVEAAEEECSGVIIGFGCSMGNPVWFANGGLEELATLGRLAVKRMSVPVAFILNEAQTFDQIISGLAYGFNVVMLDSAHLPLAEHTYQTCQVVAAARAAGAHVEAELGHLPDASNSPLAHGVAAALTDPAEAAVFVAQTGVDALAASVGNMHLLENGEATIDLDLLRRIGDAVNVPLVIHGGSGFPARDVPAAIASGVAKFNVGTSLKRAFLNGVLAGARGLTSASNPHAALGSHLDGDLLLLGKEKMKEKVISLMRLYGSAGKAS
ncbi:MAG: class II fructose-bisphosphate aldolase [Anaerolineae bacterium]|nr:class II fructose-bisphosphate aldolase [Anaerolineae bacterium]